MELLKIFYMKVVTTDLVENTVMKYINATISMNLVLNESQSGEIPAEIWPQI